MSDLPNKTYITVAVTPSTIHANNPHDDWTIHVNGYFVANVRGKRMAGEVVEGIIRRYFGKEVYEDGAQERMENRVIWALETERTYHQTFTNVTNGKGEYSTEMQEFPYGRNVFDTIREKTG